MRAKEQFLRDAEAVKVALAVTKSDGFQKLLIFAKSEFASRNPSNEQLHGANEFERILLNLPEENTELSEIPPIGLQHDLSRVPIKHAAGQPAEK